MNLEKLAIEIVTIGLGLAAATVVVWLILYVFAARMSLGFGERPGEVVESPGFLWLGRVLFAAGVLWGWWLAVAGWRTDELSPIGAGILAVGVALWGFKGLQAMRDRATPKK